MHKVSDIWEQAVVWFILSRVNGLLIPYCSFSSCVVAILKAQRSQIQSSDPLCYATYCTMIHLSETQHSAVLKRTWTQFEGRQERTAQERKEELKKDKWRMLSWLKICLVCIWCETTLKGSWTIWIKGAAILGFWHHFRSNLRYGWALSASFTFVPFLRL